MESPKLLQEPQNRSIKDFAAASDLGKTWDNIEELHEKTEQDIAKLHETIPRLYLSLYCLLLEIETLCPSSISYLEIVTKQMLIAKDKRRFDADTAKDIVKGVNSIVESLITKKSHSQVVDAPILEYNEEIKDQRKNIADIKAQYTKVCAGVSVKVATMALKEAGHYNGAISLGIFATSLLVGGVTAYRRSRNNKDLKELLLLMEAMSGKLEGLTSISTFFNDKLKAMVDAMNRYAVRIEKIIRLSSYDTEECEDDTERVIVLAQNIIENTNELKQKFDGMAKEIKSILSGLRTIILEFNPDAKLNG